MINEFICQKDTKCSNCGIEIDAGAKCFIDTENEDIWCYDCGANEDRYKEDDDEDSNKDN